MTNNILVFDFGIDFDGRWRQIVDGRFNVAMKDNGALRGLMKGTGSS